MKILDMPAHMTDEEYRVLLKGHKDEPMIKVFLSTAISKAIKEEVYRIRRTELVNEYQDNQKNKPLA